MMDITARKQAEETLARESRERRRVEEQYRLVTAAANDAVYQVDPEGCIAFATPALARLTGYTMKELLGRPSTDLYTPEIVPTFLERRRHTLNNGKAVSPYLEANMLRKDGARVPVELAVTNFIEDGRIAGRVAVVRDITARKQAEEELGRLHNELECRVEERTAELAHTVAALRAEVKERKQAEVALQASDLRYRSLFENAAEGIFLSTPEGCILDVNPALVRMIMC
jgi:PAS domain S-box-containing protein